ncbi:hypothetical protein AeMF1_006697 [Aphanomyces euteiches]|nr:hypothetical protein AeMF1_006697 [Aphanomyces euteiches]
MATAMAYAKPALLSSIAAFVHAAEFLAAVLLATASRVIHLDLTALDRARIGRSLRGWFNFERQFFDFAPLDLQWLHDEKLREKHLFDRRWRRIEGHVRLEGRQRRVEEVERVVDDLDIKVAVLLDAFPVGAFEHAVHVGCSGVGQVHGELGNEAGLD